MAVTVLVGGGCATLDRVSAGASGQEANAPSMAVAVSATGRYVAFESTATNLVPGVTNGQAHVYRKDRSNGTVVRADVGAAPVTAASLGAVSDDGAMVAFLTTAALVPADTNGTTDVYVRDIAANTTVLGSILPDGTTIPAAWGPVTSAQFAGARTLAFAIGQGPSSLAIVARDLVGATGQVLVPPMRPFANFALSRDGKHVAYTALCQVPGQNGCFEGSVEIVDLAAAYPSAPPVCDGSVVVGQSNDGRFVVVNRGVACGGRPGRFDRTNGTWIDVGLPPSASTGGRAVGVGGDARFVMLVGSDTALPGGTTGFQGAFVVDAVTGWSGRISADPVDRAANASQQPSDRYSISADGRTVAFTSPATNVVSGDTNAVVDAFARATPRASVLGAGPSALPRGSSHLAVTVTGKEFVAGAVAGVSGAGVVVHAATPSADGAILLLDVSVAAAASTGARDLTVTNVGGFGQVATVCVGCVTVS